MGRLLLLSGLGAAAVLVYLRYIRGSTDASAGLSTATADDVAIAYDTAVVDHTTWMEGDDRPDGSVMYQARVPLSVVREKLAEPYVMLLQQDFRSNRDLAAERGVSVPYVPTGKGQQDPHSIKYAIPRLYLFNPTSGRRISLYELKRNAQVWLPDMADLLESWWANAFFAACRVNAAYDVFDNVIRHDMAGRPAQTDCATRYPIAM